MTDWVNLKNSDALKEIGLDGEEYGTTAWGADIQYCRDYRATGVASTDSPFFAALRIHKNLSDNLSPTSLEDDNTVITF